MKHMQKNAHDISAEATSADARACSEKDLDQALERTAQRKSSIKEGSARVIFVIAAAFSIAAVALICVFLFANGLPAMFQIGIPDFLLGTTWKPGNNIYGIFPMILASIYVTAGAIIVGVPCGILCAMFLSRFSSGKISGLLRSGVELLAGIPSVVYGFFGLVLMVPLLREITPGNGQSLLCAAILLGIMILPTIITVSKNALDAVPASYYEGALALGANHEQATFKVVLPAAKSGIVAGVILGIGRAIGETMAVIMVAGNQAVIPTSLFNGVRTMTANIVLEMGYAADLHRGALIATGVVLIVFILIINVLFNIVKRKGEQN